MIRPAIEPVRVLVADDHPINLRLTRRLLEIDGHDVHAVGRGDEALEAALELTPDLIVADLYLPGLNGLEVARRLKSEPATCALRIVAFTAAAMESDRVIALRAGFDDYLAKPVSALQFARFIAAQLDPLALGVAG